MMLQWEVSSDESGMRLVAFLQKQLGSDYSARRLKQLVEKNLCKVNGRVERFGSATVGTGDKVTLEIEEMPPRLVIDPSQLLYEDNELFIYNKPAGIASDSDQLLNALSKDKFLKLIHRLDRDTTGALMFAKSEAVFERMVQLFKTRQIKKEYLAIVDGIPKSDNGKIDNYLGELQRYQGQTVWGEVDKRKGLRAITTWQCEKRGKNTALLRCFPETGRTHQIRVHLSSIGHPILGDHQYGKTFHCAEHMPRCMLHAFRLCFPHQTQEICVKAPLPEDFKKAIKHLFESYEDIDC